MQGGGAAIEIFQFHYGTIRSISHSDLIQFHDKRFQFHYGTIRSDLDNMSNPF